MNNIQDYEDKIKNVLEILKENLSQTFNYLKQKPEDSDQVVRIWSRTAKDSLNYGKQKSVDKLFASC